MLRPTVSEVPSARVARHISATPPNYRAELDAATATPRRWSDVLTDRLTVDAAYGTGAALNAGGWTPQTKSGRDACHRVRLLDGTAGLARAIARAELAAYLAAFPS